MYKKISDSLFHELAIQLQLCIKSYIGIGRVGKSFRKSCLLRQNFQRNLSRKSGVMFSRQQNFRKNSQGKSTTEIHMIASQYVCACVCLCVPLCVRLCVCACTRVFVSMCVFSYTVQQESLASLANHLRFAKLKPVLTINNLLADLLICQTFFHQMLETSQFTKFPLPNFPLAKLSRYTATNPKCNDGSIATIVIYKEMYTFVSIA